jgi:hypothetical protein
MIIGIDCGLSGAITVLDKSRIVEKTLIPTIGISETKKDYDIPAIIRFLEKYPPKKIIGNDVFFNDVKVVIEKTQALPGKGVVQMFHLGRGYGLMIGIISTMGYSYSLVHPKTWQGRLFKDTPHDDTKLASVAVAKRLFPDVDFRATQRCKKDHNGLTDSALIAYFGENYI